MAIQMTRSAEIFYHIEYIYIYRYIYIYMDTHILKNIVILCLFFITVQASYHHVDAMAFFVGLWDPEFCRAYLFDEICLHTQHIYSRVHGGCQSKLQEGRSLDRQWEHRKGTTFIC